MRHPRLVAGTVPLWVCLPVLECCAPYAGGSSGAIDQFFPDDIGLRPIPQGSAPRITPTNGFTWALNFGTAGIR